ncbi:MAG: transcription antitermination factor NusB [Deltaproteobacteria bacterium]|nr:transcription antitermination factor NusB [Deltaproteobacteria bacterium]
MGKRRQAREIAVQMLYKLDMSGDGLDDSRALFWENYPQPEDVREFAEKLACGVTEHCMEIDQAISQASTNWSIGRLNPVDRSILRQALFEILYCPDIPYKVTLNEAIELGKKFGSEKSGGFINGVLDHVNSRQAKQKKKA